VADDEPVRIVEFTEDDAAGIADLLVAVWPYATEYPSLWRRKRCLSPEQILEEMRAGYHYFGARLQSRLTGLYKAHLTPDGLLGEHQTVHPGFRHRGLVRAMYEQFIAYGRAIGALANLCNVLVSQESMCRLVESYGFQPQGAPYEQAPGMLVQLYRRPTGLGKRRAPETGKGSATAKRPR
jgi:GNAT superfamily N-acetyltransferase